MACSLDSPGVLVGSLASLALWPAKLKEARCIRKPPAASGKALKAVRRSGLMLGLMVENVDDWENWRQCGGGSVAGGFPLIA